MYNSIVQHVVRTVQHIVRTVQHVVTTCCHNSTTCSHKSTTYSHNSTTRSRNNGRDRSLHHWLVKTAFTVRSLRFFFFCQVPVISSQRSSLCLSGLLQTYAPSRPLRALSTSLHDVPRSRNPSPCCSLITRTVRSAWRIELSS